MTMEWMDEETIALADELAMHRFLDGGYGVDECSCGRWAGGQEDYPAKFASHRRHLAQVARDFGWGPTATTP